jgi:hypothetical protein
MNIINSTYKRNYELFNSFLLDNSFILLERERERERERETRRNAILDILARLRDTIITFSQKQQTGIIHYSKLFRSVGGTASGRKIFFFRKSFFCTSIYININNNITNMMIKPIEINCNIHIYNKLNALFFNIFKLFLL